MGSENYILGKNVCIGNNCKIGNFVVIHDDTTIGDNVRIDDHAVIGKKPMKSVISETTREKKLHGSIIGNNCIIGTSAIIYLGSTIGEKTLIADNASIREDVEIGSKCVIGRNTTIENQVKIGNRCKIQSNVQIVPSSIIEDNVFISPGVMTSNDNYASRGKERILKYKGITIKKGGRLGVACITLPGITIEEEGFVAAGAVVTKDVPSKKIVMGFPAKVTKDVPDNQLIENQ